MLREVFRQEYGGRVYPFVLIPWEDRLLGVGTVELERILLDENDIPKDQEAINIDNRFALMSMMRKNCNYLPTNSSPYFYSHFKILFQIIAGENGACPPTRSGLIHPLVSRKSA